MLLSVIGIEITNHRQRGKILMQQPNNISKGHSPSNPCFSCPLEAYNLLNDLSKCQYHFENESCQKVNHIPINDHNLILMCQTGFVRIFVLEPDSS